MTTFRFNFFEEGTDALPNHPTAGLPAAALIAPTGLPCTSGARCGEYRPPPFPAPPSSALFPVALANRTLQAVNGSRLSSEDALARNTDVVQGQYEGGFKLWEATMDAVACLHGLDIQPANVLDVGCGSGLIGTWCLTQWPGARVTFQDLNLAVLQNATAVNVSINCAPTPAGGGLARSRFVFGPWEAGAQALGVHQFAYDLIVTSETLYNDNYHLALHALLSHALAQDGRVICSSKRYYFGVGGGVTSFMRLVEELGEFQARVLHSVADGASNVRDVIELVRVRAP
jgi:SAM-dependent methyltransferase